MSRRAVASLPGADRSGAVMVAEASFFLIATRTRVTRGETRSADDPIVKAHPDSFRRFVPPPLPEGDIRS